MALPDSFMSCVGQTVFTGQSGPTRRCLLGWALLFSLCSVVCGQREFTYSYSNLFDGGLRLQNGFTEYEMLIAAEEALGLWASAAPLTFVEVPDRGPLPTSDDEAYDSTGDPELRIGHHPFGGSTLAHAFSRFFGSGLSQDVHLDDSNRTWSEVLFFSTLTHELGHALNLSHIDGVTSVMNTQLGGSNLLLSPGNSTLFAPEIAAIQDEWGTGSGRVVTHRHWRGDASDAWETHENWAEGWQPTRYSEVAFDRSAQAVVSADNLRVSSLTFSTGDNQLSIATGGHLDVQHDVVLGRRQGGDVLVAPDHTARYTVPSGPRDEWQSIEFDDTTWQTGPAGIGYERSSGYEQVIQTDVEDQMYNINGSVLMRFLFDIPDPSQISALALSMKYDDGFVAFLNGVKVESANNPSSLNWRSTATRSRDDGDALVFEEFDLTGFLPELQSGTNVLAIQGLNSVRNSSDFLIIPQLRGGPVRNQLVVDGGQLDVQGSLRLAESLGADGTLQVISGTATIRGNVGTGDGLGRVEMRGGRLRVEGGFESEVLVDEGASVAVLVPDDDQVDQSWNSPQFDDQAWQQGQSGIGFERSTGFEALIATDLEAQMFGRNASFYARIPFQRDQVADLGQLLLDVKYDDGFVAYLNGQRVASANAPDEPIWNSAALRAAAEEEATRFERFDLSSYLDLMVPGQNVLAIHGLNSSSTSNDLLLVPRLSVRRIDGVLQVSVLEFYGGTIDGISRIQGNVVHHEGELSPSRAHDTALPGQWTIDGDYQMQPSATLRIDVSTQTGDLDRLDVTGTALVSGTLALSLDDTADTLIAPLDRGQEAVLNILSSGRLAGEFDRFTLNGDEWLEGHQHDGLFRFVDQRDGQLSVRSYLATVGDTDGDADFDSDDLIGAFAAGEYADEVAENSDWTEGDWNGDQEFNSDDLVDAFATGDYLAAAAVAVPEPSSALPLLIAAAMASRLRRRSDAETMNVPSPF